MPENKIAVFETYSSYNALPGNSAKAFVQDSEGFMWIAHENGLTYFDGFNFENFDKINKYASNKMRIVSMVIDSNNNIYIGTEKKGIGVIPPSRDTILFYMNTSRDRINSMVFAHGKIIIALNNGVTVCNPALKHEKMECHKIESTIGKDVTALCEMNDSLLIAGTADGNILLLGYDSEGMLDLQKEIVIERNNKIVGIGKMSKYSVMIATPDGIKILDTKKFRLNKMLLNKQFLDNTFVTIKGILKSEFTSKLYISTEKHGIKVVDLDRGIYKNWMYTPYSKLGLNDNTISSIYEDRQANIWISTLNGEGINVYSPQSENFDRFIFHEGGRNQDRNFVNEFEHYKDNLYFVAGIGGIAIFNSLTQEVRNLHISFPGSESPLNIRALAYDKKRNILWTGIDGEGLMSYNIETNKTRYYSHSEKNNSISNDAVYDLHLDKNGILWIATWGGGLDKFNPDTDLFENISIDDFNVNNNTVIDIAADTNGNLWLATFGRCLLRYQPSDGNLYGIKYFEGMENFMHLFTLHIDAKGKIWCGSFSNGLFRYDPETKEAKVYYDIKGLNFDQISSINSDNRGDIWVASSQELCKISESDSLISFYGKNYGIQNMTFSLGATYLAKNNDLYFGTSKGFLRFQPEEISADTLLPNTKITKISVAEQDFNLLVNEGVINMVDGIPVIPYEYNSITAEFSSMLYFKSKSTRYSYFLEGFDDNWKKTTADYRKAVYTNLPPGIYTLNVISANSTGIWNYEPVSFTFKIESPFWLNGYFIFFLIIVFIVIIYAIVRWRLYALKVARDRLRQEVNKSVAHIAEQHKALEQKSRELNQKQANLTKNDKEIINQIKKINEQNRALGKQKKKIEQQTKEIQDSIDYAKNIQKALLSSEHDLEKYFPESFLILLPKYKVNGDFFWCKKQDNTIVLIVADCSGHSVHGAFMSVLCNSIFNEQLKNIVGLHPEKLVEKVNSNLFLALNNVSLSASNYDGVELSILVFNLENLELQFLGTGMPLVKKEKSSGKVIQYSSSPAIVGKNKSIVGLNHHKLKLSFGDELIVSTDGMVQQRGGPDFERFGEVRFFEKISKGVFRKEFYYDTLQEWMNTANVAEQEQTDDILILGIRISETMFKK